MARFLFIICCLGVLICWVLWHFNQERIYKLMLERLQAESRVAEVLVTDVHYDEATQKNMTTIKFVEEDTAGHDMPAKYFTFSGNLIQFQSLVIRFEDKFVAAGDMFRGRSVYLFWKAFMLDGDKTQEFPITQVDEIPGGYKIPGHHNWVEDRFWHDFWKLAFDEAQAQHAGVKSVQIEAPGSMFIPGYIYTIHIEHDGGLRIDSKAVEPILRGEKIPA